MARNHEKTPAELMIDLRERDTSWWKMRMLQGPDNHEREARQKDMGTAEYSQAQPDFEILLEFPNE